MDYGLALCVGTRVLRLNSRSPSLLPRSPPLPPLPPCHVSQRGEAKVEECMTTMSASMSKRRDLPSSYTVRSPHAVSELVLIETVVFGFVGIEHPWSTNRFVIVRGEEKPGRGELSLRGCARYSAHKAADS